MRARLKSEDGNVLVIAVMMVVLMLGLGATALSTVDTQTDVVKEERTHESTFNLVEGVLNAQAFVLGRLGTGGLTTPFPTQCTQSSTENLCPTPAQIALNYTGTTQNDYAAGLTWTSQVRDNPISQANPNITYYDPAAVSQAALYDANGDNQLWVRADATIRGRNRTLVALIRVEDIPITFPRYAVVGGGFETSNNGRKVIVDVTDPTSLGIAVRCDEVGEPDKNSNCLGYDPGKGQLDPPGKFVENYPDTPTISADGLDALEDFAKGSGTYYTNCPTNPNGAVVVVEAGDCSYTNSAPAAPGASKCCNTAANPGLLIVKCGSVSLGGNIEFRGIIYVPNKSSPESESYCSSGNVITTQGTSAILGGAIADGPGRVFAGSSGANIIFTPSAFAGITAAGTAGVVQNTWREVPDDN